MLVDNLWILPILYGLMALLLVVMVWWGRRKGFSQTIRTPKPLPFTLWLRPSKKVGSLFRARVGADFFRVKGCLGLAVLCLCGRQRRPLFNVLLSMRANFNAHSNHLLDHAKFYLIRPVPVVGYAGRRQREADEVVLGLEGWVLGKGPLSHSAADHELMHCVQDRAHDVFNWEWDVDVLWRLARRSQKCEWRIRRFLYEVHAMLFGSPLILAGAVFVLLGPLIVVVTLVVAGR